MSTQLAKPSNLREWLQSEKLKSQIVEALPKHVQPDRMMRVIFTAMQKTPKLMGCTQESLFQALITCSQLGIEPDGRRAHLIPYENRKRNITECQLIIDYKGIAELVLRSGQVSKIHADIVCEHDDFDFDMGEVRRHRIDLRKPRGSMYAAYALVQFKDGSTQAAIMSKEEVDAIRNRSMAGKSGPWVSDYNEMAKKTVFRRLSKWLPLSPEQRDIIESDDDQFERVPVKDVTPKPFADLLPDDGVVGQSPEEANKEEEVSEPESGDDEPGLTEQLEARLDGAGFKWEHLENWALDNNVSLSGDKDYEKVLKDFDKIASELAK